MIKVTYTITRVETKYVQETEEDLRALALKVAKGGKVTAIELCVCERCGGGHSLSPDRFICESCNSR